VTIDSAQLEHGELERARDAPRKRCILHGPHCTHARAVQRPSDEADQWAEVAVG
jgi:hypothetical protein